MGFCFHFVCQWTPLVILSRKRNNEKSSTEFLVFEEILKNTDVVLFLAMLTMQQKYPVLHRSTSSGRQSEIECPVFDKEQPDNTTTTTTNNNNNNNKMYA